MSQIMKLFSKSIRLHCLCALLFIINLSATAQTNTLLRRPLSTDKPMYIVHVNVWNRPDPQTTIDLIPSDIRPYVVFNLGLSVSEFCRLERVPFSIVESWARTCAENGVWCMIQPASGYLNNFSNTETEVYEYFFKNYPNFIGWNFCEQFWGFQGDSWKERLKLFSSLLKMADKFGGYLVVSCTQTLGNTCSPLGMMKIDPQFASDSKQFSKNFILCEKYTTGGGFYDFESQCLGAWLEGHSGHYGIRYDLCGWTGSGRTAPFPEATGGIPILEHFMLTGETVTDGPELVDDIAIQNKGTKTTKDGYTVKNFARHAQMDNINIDLFRKTLDKTVRIPSKQEVYDRTKIVMINDMNNSSALDMYATPASLFTNLYAFDGEHNTNNIWLKKTGRYPTIPIVYKSGTTETGSFQKVVNVSSMSSRWPTLQAKVNEFNGMFPEEYTGSIFAGRINNSWVTYHPDVVNAAPRVGVIPFKYNSCDSLSLSHGWYGMSNINEFRDSLQVYLNNYCSNVLYGVREDILKVYGSTLEPVYYWKDRSSHVASIVTKTWENGVFTLSVKHNGPLDITIKCSGNATNRLTEYPSAVISAVPAPPMYAGPRQYEAEDFEYRNGPSVVEGANQNFTGMSNLKFSTNSGARTKDTVSVLRDGLYRLTTRYRAPKGAVSNIDLYVNYVRAGGLVFDKTPDVANAWNTLVQNIKLKSGKNIVEFRARTTNTFDLYLDNIVIDQTLYDFNFEDTTIPPANMTLRGGTAGLVSFTDANQLTSTCFKALSTGGLNATGVSNLDLFRPDAADYSITWKEYPSFTGSKKGMLLRGGELTCPYADGLQQGYLFVSESNSDSTVTLRPYVADGSGIQSKSIHTSSFRLSSKKPCWFRATAFGNQLIFECSKDSIHWEGGSATTFTDSNYAAGSTQLVWGLNSDIDSWNLDNISFSSGEINVVPSLLTGFSYVEGTGPSTTSTFAVSANELYGDVQIVAPVMYEVSLSSSSGFAASLSLPQNNGSIGSTLVYVRLKAGLYRGTYNDTIHITSERMAESYVILGGEVQNAPTTKSYTFTSDVATTYATSPPALNVAVSNGNTATAGVITYTDSKAVTSNVLKPYGGGQREGTGVLNLNRFSKKATNYTITWKQCLGSATENYKIGVLMRGNPDSIGTGSNGYYVTGMMQGYLFIANTNRGSSNTSCRIYKSTKATSLINVAMTDVNLNPTATQPIWYRASVSGNAVVYLKLEYSTDGTTWKTGTSFTDNDASFKVGGTQLVWGLGAYSLDFNYDDIIYNGVALDEGMATDIIPLTGDAPTVVSTAYFNLLGQRIPKLRVGLKGLILEVNTMSDGTIRTSKVLYN